MKFTKTVIAALAIGASVAAHAEGVEWSGFGSLYYTQAFDNNFLVGGANNNRPDFTQNSLLGFNVGSRINDEVTVAAQLVLAGTEAQSENFDMYAQWAYLNYKPTDSVTLKLGRQLWPVLISSEYQRVHFLLPQANIPRNVYYLLPFVSFDGASATKSFNTGAGTFSMSAYAGNPKINASGEAAESVNVQKLMGARLALEGSGWKVQATANRTLTVVTINSVGYSIPPIATPTLNRPLS